MSAKHQEMRKEKKKKRREQMKEDLAFQLIVSIDFYNNCIEGSSTYTPADMHTRNSPRLHFPVVDR